MEIETVVAALPDDLISVVLGRLSARSLAASRCVCKAWRDLIDERQLLVRIRRLLPYSVRGLFINYSGYPRAQFLSRPTLTSSPEDDGPGRRFDGKLDFFMRREYPGIWYNVLDHCNGLVLVRERGELEVLHVCNPTTQWSTHLPPLPGRISAWNWNSIAFLVFDPFVSSEYKVLLSPEMEPLTWMELMENGDAWRKVEWPPLEWATWHEFSSSSGRWEKKVLVRAGEAAGRAADLLAQRPSTEPPYRYAAYWKGALYIHCPGQFVSRLSLVDDKYRVIKSPIKLEADDWSIRVPSFLGTSEKGVYFAAITNDAFTKVQVWTLCESSNNQMEWVPKDQSNMKVHTYSWCLENNKFDDSKYWTALDVDPEYWKLHRDDGRETQDTSVEENVCWNSDDDNIVDVCWNPDDDNTVDVSDDEEEVLPYVNFLGFHPYKEVIFLDFGSKVVASDLNSPKVQYLGLVSQGHTLGRSIEESFVYTPCLVED